MRRGGVIEDREHSFDRLQQVQAYPAPVAAFIRALQTPVLEAPDHHQVRKQLEDSVQQQTGGALVWIETVEFGVSQPALAQHNVK